MDLHSEIMNIKALVPVEALEDGKVFAYKIGHRDPRHAAAELALKADARIEELESVLSKLMDKARYTLCSSHFDELDEYLESLLENK